MNRQHFLRATLGLGALAGWGGPTPAGAAH